MICGARDRCSPHRDRTHGSLCWHGFCFHSRSWHSARISLCVFIWFFQGCVLPCEAMTAHDRICLESCSSPVRCSRMRFGAIALLLLSLSPVHTLGLRRHRKIDPPKRRGEEMCACKTYKKTTAKKEKEKRHPTIHASEFKNQKKRVKNTLHSESQ